MADAVRIARVSQAGGSSMGMAEADPFDGSLMDPLEDTLDDLAIEWSETPEDEGSLIWGRWYRSESSSALWNCLAQWLQ